MEIQIYKNIYKIKYILGWCSYGGNIGPYGIVRFQEIPFPKAWHLDKSQHSLKDLRQFLPAKRIVPSKSGIWLMHLPMTVVPITTSRSMVAPRLPQSQLVGIPCPLP